MHDLHAAADGKYYISVVVGISPHHLGGPTHRPRVFFRLARKSKCTMKTQAEFDAALERFDALLQAHCKDLAKSMTGHWPYNSFIQALEVWGLALQREPVINLDAQSCPCCDAVMDGRRYRIRALVWTQIPILVGNAPSTLFCLNLGFVWCWLTLCLVISRCRALINDAVCFLQILLPTLFCRSAFPCCCFLLFLTLVAKGPEPPSHSTFLSLPPPLPFWELIFHNLWRASALLLYPFL